MPWKETDPLQERRKFIEDWLSGGSYNMAALCRLYQISRKTGYKWTARFREAGLEGLEERSHEARSQPLRISEALERAVVEARRTRPSWGPKKLKAWLEQREPATLWPAASTIGEALKRAGLVRPRQRRRRLSGEPSPLPNPQRANQVWTVDYKGQFRTGDGVMCYPLTVVDGHSRYLLDCAAHPRPGGREARASLERLFRERGLPETMRSDNGSPFASTGAGRLSRLSVWWLKLGVAVERIDPGKPQQNGRHERLHRTLKAETARPPAATARRQQERFDGFRAEYNQERPHESLGQQPPASQYAASQRRYPQKLEDPEYPGHWERRRVRSDGGVKFQGRTRFLSEALAGELVGWVEVAEDIWQIWFGPAEVAIFDADAGEIWPLGKTAKTPRGGS